MNSLLCLSSLLLLAAFGQIESVLNPRVVCYYESWFIYRGGTYDGKMTVSDLDSSLCTDIVYGYLGVTESSQLKIVDAPLMVEKHDFENFVKAKGSARALIVIGGVNLSPAFHLMIDTVQERDTFTASVLAFFKQYNFDGISIDWTRNSWTETEFSNFVDLLKRMRTAFGTKYTLGVTVSALDVNFKAKDVDAYVDFISVQTFDLHGSWDKTVELSAPLDWQIETLQKWFDAGATRNKLLATIPLYGHTWLLSDTSKTAPGSDASGPAPKGPISQADGKLGYNEICTQVTSSPANWALNRDSAKAEVYAVNKATKVWISYEDPVSAEQKTRNITTEGFGGVVVQALANEDFRGVCGVKYPILKGINKGLNKNAVAPVTRAPITEPPVITADPTKICHEQGEVRDPKDCTKYHVCTEFFPGILNDELHSCPSGEAYDKKLHKCADKATVKDCP